MNTVCIIGRLGKDPELKYIQDGKAVAQFSVALDEGKDKDPSWVDVTAWEKTAEAVGQYLQQGDECAVTGRLRRERWQTEGGDKRSRLVVVASSVDFGRKKGESAGGSAVPQGREAAVAAGFGGGAVGAEEDPFGSE